MFKKTKFDKREKFVKKTSLPSSSVITETGLLASLSPNAFTAEMRREYRVFGVNPFTDHEVSEAGIVTSLVLAPRVFPILGKKTNRYNPLSENNAILSI